MPIFVQPQGERMQFENAYNALAKNKGVSKAALDNAVLTQSYLRMIQPVVINQSVINFNVLNIQTGTGLVRPDENRLNQQDAFFTSKIFCYLFKSAGYNWTPNTYPNAITYPTGSAQLNLLYTGYLVCNINNALVMPKYRMLQFLKSPSTQLTGATNSPIDGFEGLDLMPLEPNVVMVGTYQSTFQIQMPTGLTAVDANTYVVLELGGVLAQNVALGAPQ